jgi:Mrp family chromosome partitioning ATPase
MKNSEILERLGVTRARVEAAVPRSSVVAVTSALPSDGSGFLAAGLAQSLASVGHDVLLVRTSGPSSISDRTTPLRGRRNEHDGKSGEPDVLNLGRDGAPASYSLESAQSIFERFRERYAFTVVDAGNVLDDGTALSLARAADAVLISFEQGRAGRDADRELGKVLKSAGAKMLGVVTVQNRTMDSFTTVPEPASLQARTTRADVEDVLPRNAASAAATSG